ncbi:MAG: MFS transporter [Sphingomonadales bacterium]
MLRSTVLSLSALLVGASLMFVGHGIQSTLVPVWANDAGFDAATIGSLWSAYAAGLVLGCMTAGRVIGMVGHIRAFAAMMSAVAIIVLIYTFYPTPAFWLLLRVAHGFVIAGVFMIMESWLNEKAHESQRGVILGIYTALSLVMISMGQLSLNIFDVLDPRLFSLAAILLMMAVLPVALTRAGIPGPVKSSKLDVGKLWKSSRVAVIGSFCVGLTTSAFWGLGPVFALEVGLNTAGLTLFMSATILGGAIFQWLVGRASDRMDRRRVVAMGSFVAAGAGVGIWLFAGHSLLMVLLFSLLFGGFSFSLHAVCVALGNDRAAAGDFVEVAGGLLFVHSAGSIIGPLLAAGAMSLFGPGGIYAFTALVHVSLALFAVTLVVRRAPVPVEERGEFVAVPVTSPEIYVIDPRGEHEGEHDGEPEIRAAGN